jgi:large subunit ribosomal protein L6
MSRIGRLPIKLPQGVSASIDDANVVSVSGPKGQLNQKIHQDITVKQEEGTLFVSRPSDNKLHRSLHGLSRSLIFNMVNGVANGYQKGLDLVGTGYRAQVNGKILVLTVGYSHPVEINPPEGIQFECPTNTKVLVKGIDKQLVGEVAANVRKVRKPEPYLGKGIKYENEVVRRKEGKSGN